MRESMIHPNIEMLTRVAGKLDYLLPEVVFVGGSVVSLLLSEKNAPEVRYTVDVDCVINIVTKTEYYKFEEKLRELGFQNSLGMDDPIGRWKVDNELLDVVPVSKNVIGFGNNWYHSTIKNPQKVSLNRSLWVNIIDAPHFLATKFEAFHDRGNDDYLTSHDIEDIVAIIDGRDSIVHDILSAQDELQSYLAKKLKQLLSSQDFTTSLPGHLNFDGLVSQRVELTLERMQQIVESVTI